MKRFPVSQLPPLPRSLEFLARIDESNFRILLERARGAKDFDFNLARLKNLAEEIGETDLALIFGFFASISYLYTESREWAEADETPEETVREFLRFTNFWPKLGDEPEKTFARLSQLLQDNPKIDTNQKRKWLSTGIIDRAVSFSSFVDLRPNFSNDRGQILEILPITIFQVTIETQTGDQRSIVFQLNDTALSQFRKTIEDIEAKIKTIKNTKPLADYLPEENR